MNNPLAYLLFFGLLLILLITPQKMDSTIVFWFKIAGFALLALGGILGGAAYVVGQKDDRRKFDAQQKEKEEHEHKQALSGKLTPKKERIDNGLVTLRVGNNIFTYDIDRLSKGVPFTPIMAPDGPTFTLKIDGKKILLTGTFRSIDNKITAEIFDNEWKVNPNNYFDRNYTDNELEIIDTQGITKLQFEFVNANMIDVSGVLKIGSGLVFAAKGESIEGRPIHAMTVDEMIALSIKIPNVFVYPSGSHFGEKAKK
jgi:hypothetical protein